MSSKQYLKSKKDKDHKWNNLLVPIANLLVSKEGVRTKTAALSGRKHVTYCRGQDLLKWFNNHIEKVKREASTILEENNNELKTNEDITELLELLIKDGFIFKAIPEVLEGDNSKPPKWPKRLNVSNRDIYDFNESSFYVIKYEKGGAWGYLLLGCIMAGVIILCLWPAWPTKIKIAVWYLGFSFSVVMLGLTVLRLILFVIVWFFGIDFWLFPNLLSDEASVVESFQPTYTYEKRHDSWHMRAARVFLAILLAATVFQLSRHHTLGDVGDFTKRSFLDVLAWGTKHISDGPVTQSSVPDISQFEGEVSEEL